MPTRPAARKPPSRRAAPARRAPATRPAATPTRPAGPPPGQTTFVLDVPFADRAVAQAAGATWDAHARAWAYTGASLPAALHPYRSLPYSWERWQEEERNGTRRAPNPGAGDVTLRPHQLEATALGLQARQLGRSGFLLADEVGVGKTYAALNLALKTSARNVLVVCPLGVCAVWRAALARMGDGGKRFLVINYDRLHKLLEAPAAAADARKAATVRRMTARAGKPRVDFDLVIADEAHNLRNPATQRSRCVQRLAWRKDVFTVRLSATAGQNPLELSYLAPLLAESTGWKVAEMKDFGAWCKSIGLRVTKANGRWTWTRNDADLETCAACSSTAPSRSACAAAPRTSPAGPRSCASSSPSSSSPPPGASTTRPGSPSAASSPWPAKAATPSTSASPSCATARRPASCASRHRRGRRRPARQRPPGRRLVRVARVARGPAAGARRSRRPLRRHPRRHARPPTASTSGSASSAARSASSSSPPPRASPSTRASTTTPPAPPSSTTSAPAPSRPPRSKAAATATAAPRTPSTSTSRTARRRSSSTACWSACAMKAMSGDDTETLEAILTDLFGTDDPAA